MTDLHGTIRRRVCLSPSPARVTGTDKLVRGLQRSQQRHPAPPVLVVTLKAALERLLPLLQVLHLLALAARYVLVHLQAWTKYQ
jgi:hypothetical protein